jgi:hypothetical protein
MATPKPSLFRLFPRFRLVTENSKTVSLSKFPDISPLNGCMNTMTLPFPSFSIRVFSRSRTTSLFGCWNAECLIGSYVQAGSIDTDKILYLISHAMLHMSVINTQLLLLTTVIRQVSPDLAPNLSLNRSPFRYLIWQFCCSSALDTGAPPPVAYLGGTPW